MLWLRYHSFIKHTITPLYSMTYIRYYFCPNSCKQIICIRLIEICYFLSTILLLFCRFSLSLFLIFLFLFFIFIILTGHYLCLLSVCFNLEKFLYSVNNIPSKIKAAVQSFYRENAFFPDSASELFSHFIESNCT